MSEREQFTKFLDEMLGSDVRQRYEADKEALREWIRTGVVDERVARIFRFTDKCQEILDACD